MAATEESAPAPSEQLETELENIEPMYDARTQVLRIGEDKRAYVQKPLGFFAKMRFTSLIGTTIDEAMKGDGALSIASLFGGAVSRDGVLMASDVGEADMFVRGLTKLAATAPDLLADVYVIALGVPPSEVLWAKAAMEQPPEDGGLSDEDGIAILDTFIDQNAEALRAFFTEKMAELAKRARARLGIARESSKPSRATRRATQRQSKS